MRVAPPKNSLEIVNRARVEAQRLRAEWLLRVETGQSTIFDVIEAAELPFSEPLRAMKMSVLLRADHTVARHTNKIITRLAYEGAATANTRTARSKTPILVGWFYAKPKTDLPERRINLLYDIYLSFANAGAAPSDTFPWTY